MTDLLDPKQDYIFKNIFGNEERKPLLISFLNSLLYEGKPHIKSLTLNNPNIEKILEKDKSSRLDIRATTDDKKTVLNIEIQIKNTGEIPERAIQYLANTMPRTIKSKESYKKSNVIGIWVLGENVTDRKNAISDAYMTFQANGSDPYQIMAKNARIVFIELPKFNPKKSNVNDLLTAWLSFLKDPVFMDESFLKVEEVHEAMDTLKYISADPDIRAIADLRQRTMNDRNSELTVARDEGIEIGKAKGLAEGEAKGASEKARETARKMLSENLPLEIIIKCTGLTEVEIKELQ